MKKRRTGVTHSKKKAKVKASKAKKKIQAKRRAAPRKKVAAKKVARARKAVAKTKTKRAVVKKAPILVGFCLDETASMEARKSVTISSYNEYVEGLAKSGGNVRFWLLRFNSSKMDDNVAGVKAEDIPRLTVKGYRPRMNTPLYDAIARLITLMDHQAAAAATSPLIVILTDGEENESRIYNRQNIHDLIEQRTAKGWTFVYLGVGSEAWQGWKDLGIQPGNVARTPGTVRGMSLGMEAVASASVAYVSSGGQQTNSFYQTPDNTQVKVGGEWEPEPEPTPEPDEPDTEPPDTPQEGGPPIEASN